MKRALIAIAAMLLLQGCGFEPLYADTSTTETGGGSTLSTIYVEPISDRIGYDLRNDLLDRLDASSSVSNARYRLRLSITELEEPVVFLPNTSITRYNYTLTAHYDLVAKDAAQPLKSNDIRAFAAYNAAASPYLFSTVAAQRDAKRRAAHDIAERIRIELAVYLRQVAQQTR